MIYGYKKNVILPSTKTIYLKIKFDLHVESHCVCENNETCRTEFSQLCLERDNVISNMWKNTL